MTSEIDVDRGLVLTRLSGTVTVAEVEEHNRGLANNPQFRPHFKQLVDLRELIGVPYDSGEVRKSAVEHVFSPGARRALVTASEAAFGMSRMFALQSELVGQRIEVFRDMEAAKAWLDFDASVEHEPRA